MINIVYCGNKKVIDGIYISSLSIIKNSKEPINFYILTMDLTDIDKRFSPITDKQIVFLNNSVKNNKYKVNFIKEDVGSIFRKELHESLGKNSSYTPYALIRLLLDKVSILPNKVLYLDTDTVANKDLSPLYHTDLTNKEAAAAVDHIGKFWMRWMKKNYFNSGVMLYNLEMIKSTGMFERCRHYVLTKKSFLLDQDALNRQIKYFVLLDSKYNRQNGYHKDCVIQHFSKRLIYFPYIHTRNIKPWNVELVHSVLKISSYDDILNEYLKNKKYL